MILYDVVKSWFSGSGTGRLYIIDGAQLVGSGSSDRLSPRDNVHVLQMLSRYAQKEAISIQVAFEGRPLREVAHGGEYGGVTVFFADKQAALQDMILDLVRSGARRQKVVLVTAQRQIEEKAVSAGAQTLRPSTLRKAMENGGGGDRGGDRGDRGGDRGDRGSRRGGRRQRGRGGRSRDRDSGGQGPSEQQSSPSGQQESAPSSSSGQEAPTQAPAPASPPDPSRDAVRDLIDLVE